MKGNIIAEARKVVKDLYLEGHEEVFAFSIVENNGDVSVQVSDFDLKLEDLSKDYKKTYTQAQKTMRLAKNRYGNKCTAINVLICDEVSENVFMDNHILRIMNLNL